MVFSETGVRGAAGPVVRNWTASNNKTEKARIGKEKKTFKKEVVALPSSATCHYLLTYHAWGGRDDFDRTSRLPLHSIRCHRPQSVLSTTCTTLISCAYPCQGRGPAGGAKSATRRFTVRWVVFFPWNNIREKSKCILNAISLGPIFDLFGCRWRKRVHNFGQSSRATHACGASAPFTFQREFQTYLRVLWKLVTNNEY